MEPRVHGEMADSRAGIRRTQNESGANGSTRK